MRKTRRKRDEIPGGRWREPEARRVLEWWRKSGLSANAFARSSGLASAQRLSWWRKRLERADVLRPASLTFIPAEVTSGAVATVVRLPGGVALELMDAAAVPAAWIAALATELKRQS